MRVGGECGCARVRAWVHVGAHLSSRSERMRCRLVWYLRRPESVWSLVMKRPKDWPEAMRLVRNAQLRMGSMCVPSRCTRRPRSRKWEAYLPAARGVCGECVRRENREGLEAGGSWQGTRGRGG